jgi:Flp pilus assembly protein TadD
MGVLLASLTFASFSPLLQASFVYYDDQVYVTENPHALSGVTWSGLAWAFSNIDFGFYYPLTWISHMLDCQLFGLWAPGHHLTSVAIHVLNALLLFRLLAVATGFPWRSWLVAALFALHPMHVESVAWISERKDVLSTLFLFLALLAYGHYARHPRLSRYALAFGLLCLGLMSKSMLVTAPALMLLADVWPLGRLREGTTEAEGWAGVRGHWSELAPRVRGLLAEKIPLAVLCAVFGFLTLLAQSRGGAVAPIQGFSLAQRLGAAAVGYATYLTKLVFPVNLAVLYPMPTTGWPTATVLLSSILLALVTLLAVRLGRARLYWPIGWAWFLVAIAPVSGILQVGAQAFADRYTYVAYIGLFVPIVWSGAETAGRLGLPRWVKVIGCGALVAALAAGSWHQCGYWRDGETLFAHSLKAGGTNGGMLNSLALTYLNRGEPLKAIPLLKEATLLNSRDEKAWGNLGHAFREIGRLPEARACYQRVLEISPREGKAIGALGLLKELDGDLDGAGDLYRKAVEESPTSPGARIHLGRALAQAGKDDEAYREFRRAAELNPNLARPWYYMGLLEERAGRSKEAEANYRKAIRLSPAMKSARAKLVSLLNAQGRVTEARAIEAEGEAGERGAVGP